MGPPGVVAFHPLPDTGFQFRERGVFLEVEILVFVAPPEPFDEDIVHPPALPIHAHFNAQRLDPSRPFRRGELAALVGVEDFRQAQALRHSGRHGLFRQCCVHRIAHCPPQHLAGMPVHHRAQVGVPVRHRDIRDVRAPDFVGVFHDPIPQQIRVFSVPVVWNARAPGTAPDRLDPHFSPQPLEALSIDFDPVVALQQRPQPSAPDARIHRVDLVQYPHDPCILRALLHRLVVQRRACNSEDFTLRSHTQLRMFFFHQPGPFHRL